MPAVVERPPAQVLKLKRSVKWPSAGRSASASAKRVTTYPDSRLRPAHPKAEWTARAAKPSRRPTALSKSNGTTERRGRSVRHAACHGVGSSRGRTPYRRAKRGSHSHLVSTVVAGSGGKARQDRAITRHAARATDGHGRPHAATDDGPLPPRLAGNHGWARRHAATGGRAGHTPSLHARGSTHRPATDDDGIAGRGRGMSPGAGTTGPEETNLAGDLMGASAGR